MEGSLEDLKRVTLNTIRSMSKDEKTALRAHLDKNLPSKPVEKEEDISE